MLQGADVAAMSSADKPNARNKAAMYGYVSMIPPGDKSLTAGDVNCNSLMV